MVEKEKDLVVENISKSFGQFKAVDEVSFYVERGKFFSILGPSGCGKTTLLRMIAGFNSIEGGDFYFNDTRINDLNPSLRNIGMVFQNYAIFPHLNVRKNVEFGLKNKKFPKDQIAGQTDRFLKLMQIDSFANRMPYKLSGGQQQRVALARALVIQPDVLLMDEPLSNLDAKLRVEMRSVIKQIQHSVGITTIYVTHDQEEAMAVSDRIAVMNAGRIEQIGTPGELYERPSSPEVAAFVGLSSIVPAVSDGAVARVWGLELPLLRSVDAGAVEIFVRPENVRLVTTAVPGIDATVQESTFLGSFRRTLVRTSDGAMITLQHPVGQAVTYDDVVRVSIDPVPVLARVAS